MAVPLEFYREENRQGTKRLSMADYAIECKKITKTFGSVVANDQIDLKVKKVRSWHCLEKTDQERQP